VLALLSYTVQGEERLPKLPKSLPLPASSRCSQSEDLGISSSTGSGIVSRRVKPFRFLHKVRRGREQNPHSNPIPSRVKLQVFYVFLQPLMAREQWMGWGER
jgi:hypothetical protein